MNENLSKLVELQKIDKEIVKLKKSLEEFPLRYSHQKKLHDEKETALNEFKNTSHDFTKRKREIELELKNEESKLNKLKIQLNDVKTNKEYTTMNHEIDLFGNKIDQLETEELELMDKEEKYNEELKKKMQLFEEHIIKYNQEIERLKLSEQEKKNQLEGFMTERILASSKIPAEYLETYEKLNTRYPASATAEMTNATCNGCLIQLVEQKAIEVKHSADLIFCEHCKRILYTI